MTDHAAEARRVVAAARKDNDQAMAGIDDIQLELAFAQVHATLALADEQRTANLIAQRAYLVSLVNGTGQSLSECAAEEFRAIEAEVDARLGLTPTTPEA